MGFIAVVKSEVAIDRKRFKDNFRVFRCGVTRSLPDGDPDHRAPAFRDPGAFAAPAVHIGKPQTDFSAICAKAASYRCLVGICY
jgi:hypothetical protein